MRTTKNDRIRIRFVWHCTSAMEKLFSFIPNQTIPGLAIVDLVGLEVGLDEEFRQAVKQITELLLKTFPLELLGR